MSNTSIYECVAGIYVCVCVCVRMRKNIGGKSLRDVYAGMLGERGLELIVHDPLCDVAEKSTP
jgi:hypothetical protein